MRLPTSAHTSHPWRIHEIAPDFALEDVWAVPASGEADDFPMLLDVFSALEFPDSAPFPVRLLWNVRDQLGRWCGLGRISTEDDDPVHALPIPGTGETTLLNRLPDDLRGTALTAVAPGPPFRPLYRTAHEYAAEVSNRTVHAVLHLGWIDRGDDRYRGQMAVLVKPRGRFGNAYMAFIKPFRYLLVYPALMKAIERAWRRRRMGPGTPGHDGAAQHADVPVHSADQLTVTTIRPRQGGPAVDHYAMFVARAWLAHLDTGGAVPRNADAGRC